MSKGFIGNKALTGRMQNSSILRISLVLSIIAAVFIATISLTVMSANNLMNIDKNEVTNVSFLLTARRALNLLTVRRRCRDGSSRLPIPYRR